MPSNNVLYIHTYKLYIHTNYTYIHTNYTYIHTNYTYIHTNYTYIHTNTHTYIYIYNILTSERAHIPSKK